MSSNNAPSYSRPLRTHESGQGAGSSMNRGFYNFVNWAGAQQQSPAASTVPSADNAIRSSGGGCNCSYNNLFGRVKNLVSDIIQVGMQTAPTAKLGVRALPAGGAAAAAAAAAHMTASPPYAADSNALGDEEESDDRIASTGYSLPSTALSNATTVSQAGAATSSDHPTMTSTHSATSKNSNIVNSNSNSNSISTWRSMARTRFGSDSGTSPADATEAASYTEASRSAVAVPSTGWSLAAMGFQRSGRSQEGENG